MWGLGTGGFLFNLLKRRDSPRDVVRGTGDSHEQAADAHARAGDLGVRGAVAAVPERTERIRA